MGIREDRIELEAWRDKKPIPPWLDGSGRTGMFVQGEDGKWTYSVTIPPLGTSYVEIMRNGEVRQYENRTEGNRTYQIIGTVLKD